MKFKILTAAASVAALSLSAMPSQAAVYLFNYVSSGGNPFAASGSFTTSDVLNGAGAYDVLSISGNVDGDLITSLIGNPAQPNPSLSADGLFIYDNNYFPGPQHVSNPGLFFASAAGYEYNLFSDNATTYELYRATPGVGYVNNSIGTLTVSSAIPEPATWALMITGFGMMGLALRRRRAQDGFQQA